MKEASELNSKMEEELCSVCSVAQDCSNEQVQNCLNNYRQSLVE